MFFAGAPQTSALRSAGVGADARGAARGPQQVRRCSPSRGPRRLRVRAVEGAQGAAGPLNPRRAHQARLSLTRVQGASGPFAARARLGDSCAVFASRPRCPVRRPARAGSPPPPADRAWSAVCVPLQVERTGRCGAPGRQVRATRRRRETLCGAPSTPGARRAWRVSLWHGAPPGEPPAAPLVQRRRARGRASRRPR